MKTRWQNPFDYFDKIYYINLDRRVDRRQQVENELAKLNIQADRISGVVHEKPATGCHLSHAKIFDDALQSGYDRILIFEDDVEFFPNALENFTASLQDLPTEWDMFYLGANLDAYRAYQVKEHIARLEGAYATHAYAVRRTLFRALFEINADTEVVHNDVTYTQQIHPNYACYLALPLVAGQRDSFSDIQRTMMSSNNVFLTRLETNLVRMNERSDVYNPNNG